MKIKFYLAIFLTIILVGCASTPQRIGNAGINGATSFLPVQNEADTLEGKTCQPTVSVVAQKNMFESNDEATKTKKPASSLTIEDRVLQLETMVGEHEKRISDHDQKISNVMSKLARNYRFLADIRNRPEIILNQTNDTRANKLKMLKVTFYVGRNNLFEEERSKIDEIINQNPDMKSKIIIGATDPSGTTEENKNLAQARANAFEEYLALTGINVSETKVILEIGTFKYGSCDSENRVAILYYE